MAYSCSCLLKYTFEIFDKQLPKSLCIEPNNFILKINLHS
jgi:hypothetical protein